MLKVGEETRTLIFRPNALKESNLPTDVLGCVSKMVFGPDIPFQPFNCFLRGRLNYRFFISLWNHKDLNLDGTPGMHAPSRIQQLVPQFIPGLPLTGQN